MLSKHAAHTTIPILQTSEIIRKLLLFLEKNFFDVMHTLHIIHSIRAVTIILVSLTALTSCTQRQWRHAQGAAWGTSYHITYFSNRVLDDSVVAVMRNVELSLSPFEPASNISRINRGDTDIADRNVQRVFARAMEIWKCSNGCFDPTIAPLVNLWGFGTKEGDELPDSATVASTLLYVSMGKCRIDAHGRITKGHKETSFDFSAITKGYGVDCVARMLERNGVSDYIVEIGGEIVCRGHNPHGLDWQVQIDAPIADSVVTHRRYNVVPLKDAAMATSGNYRNFRTLPDGRRVGHTISPITGYPLMTPTLSATVIAPDCMSADALATACMAMDADKALTMVRALGKGYSVMLIVDTPQGIQAVSSHDK